MKPSLFYKIASILLLLFAIGHTLGFRQVDPKWGIDQLLQTLQSTRFRANGSDRTYWDFYVGFGFFVTVLLLFASAIAWQLGSLPQAVLASMRIAAWSFVICFAVVAFLSWRYFFFAPAAFSIAILVCLALGAWLARAPAN
jgi:hypothetical protein